MSAEFSFNIDNWEYFCSFARWYPDAFLDLIRPEKGGISLDIDQRIYLRCMCRFTSFYGTFPRGYSKTFNEVLASTLNCVFFPNMEIALSAQTKENSADLIKDKFTEIMRYYPMLKNEVVKTNFAKGDALVLFKNGSKLTNLANAQSSKGQRRRRMNIEESALIDNATFQDALLPIVEVPRVCVGKCSLIDPEELNQQVNFFTTSGYKGSDEYLRSVSMIKDMIDLKGKIVLGSGFWLPCWNGHGSSKSQIFQKKKDMSATAFAQNYESKWVGASDNSFVNINRLLECRSLTTTITECKNDKDEYYLGVDVARSQKTSNNQSFIAVVKVNRNKDKTKIVSMDLVNLINIPNILNFTAQAAKIKHYQKLYNAKVVVLDANGLGVGLVDELLKESFDPLTKESLGCWDTINDDNNPELPDSPKILYALKAQGIQTQIISNFIDCVDSGKFRILVHKNDSEFSAKEQDNFEEEIAPFYQTDILFEEIANLKLKHMNNGGLGIEKVVSKLDKDRVSATIYTLWYINEYCKDLSDNSDYDFDFTDD